jgi:hypothetical protein
MKPLCRIPALHTTILKPKIAAADHPEERRVL